MHEEGSAATMRDREELPPQDSVPMRRPHVHAREVEGEMVVLDPDAELVHQLNRTASFIWNRCDGQRSIDQIATDLAEAFDVDPRTAAKDVASTVRALEHAGLITTGRQPC